MSIILNVRGNMGSGKTTAVRELLERLGPAEPLFRSGAKKPWAYRLAGLSVLGTYERVCGGAENIPFAEIQSSALELAAEGDVVFEAFLWSTVFKSSDEFARRCAPSHRVIFAYLDTPAAICVQRVEARKKEKVGFQRSFDPENVFKKERQVRAAFDKLKAAGHETRELSWKETLPSLLEMLGRKVESVGAR